MYIYHVWTGCRYCDCPNPQSFRYFYESAAMCDLPPLSPERTCGWYPFSGLTFPSWHEVETCASAYHKTVLTSTVFIWAICRYSECTESRILSDERCVASSKAKSQRRYSASSFKCQHLFRALRSCSNRYIFFLVFSALLSFLYWRVFWEGSPMEDVANPVILLFIVYRMYRSS
jgi:hypothetical protein